ncbi:MAG TPA: XRE family transcriptional regulator [Thermomicrobiales bacterium]
MGRRENPIPEGTLDSLPLGARMRLARHRAGLGLGELANLLGYTKAHLSAVENGTTRPSRQLVVAYERALQLPPGELMATYEADPAGSRPARGTATAANADPGLPSVDAALAAILTDLALPATERMLVHHMVVEEARAKAQAVRAAADWWRQPGPVPVCCVPIAGWQWHEWSRDEIVDAIDRAAAEAMQARIREIVVVLPAGESAAMAQAFRRPSFVQRLQAITPVEQGAPLGLGHAILQASPVIQDRPFAVILPDNQFDSSHRSDATVLQQLVEQYAARRTSVLAVAKLKRRRRHYGLARLRAANSRLNPRPIALLAEKPGPDHPIYQAIPDTEPEGVYAAVGRYVCSPAVLSSLSYLQERRPTGARLELTDALQWLIDHEVEAVAANILQALVQLDREETIFVATQPAADNRSVA